MVAPDRRVLHDVGSSLKTAGILGEFTAAIPPAKIAPVAAMGEGLALTAPATA